MRVSLETPSDGAWALLSVASDGAPIPLDVEPYLFEPFHSTLERALAKNALRLVPVEHLRQVYRVDR